MRRFAMVLMVTLAGGVGSVAAQTSGAATAAESHPWYGELAAAATLGHKSSASAGLEAGYSLSNEWQVFLEAGRMENVATADLDQRAQLIANSIGGGVTSSIQRAAYLDLGVKYYPAPIGMWHPYVLLGLGGASVKTTVDFSNPNNVPVQIGNDFHSTLTKFFLTTGAGVTLSFGSRYLVDVGYRYGRIFPKTSAIEADPGINTQRVQAAIGMRF